MSIFRSGLIISICAALTAACSSKSTPNTTADAGTDAGTQDAGPHDAGPVGDGGAPPGAPVLSFTTSAAGVQLAWTLPGAFGGETFNLLRSDQAAPFAAVAGATSLSADGYSDPISSVLPGAGHSYEVTASNGNGTGPASNIVEVLQAPGDVAAAGSDTRILLIWSPVQNATSYDVYRVPAADAGGSSTLLSNVIDGEYVDTQSITTGATYNYQVLAHPIDGGQLSTGSNIASAPALGIDVSRNGTFVSDVFDGGVVLPESSNSTAFSALRLQSDGGNSEYDSLSTSTATVIPGVPTGPYLLTYSSDPFQAGVFIFLTLTSSRTLDGDFTMGGRSDAVIPTNLVSETTMAYALTGLDAWSEPDGGPNDTLQSMCTGAGNSVFGLEFDLNGFDGDAGISAGQTTLTGKENIDGTFDDPFLVDSTRGDIYYLYQLHNATSGNGNAYQTINKSYTNAAITMVDGQSTPISGPMAAATQTAIPDLVVKNSAFAAQGSAVNPAATNTGETVLIQTIKDFSTYGNYIGPTPTMFSTTVSGATNTDVDFGSVSWGNPFPSDWQPFVAVTYSFNVPFDLTGAAAGVTYKATSQYYRPIAALNWATDIVPLLSPVTNVKINTTLDAFTDQTGVTTSPTISWAAGSGTAPTAYTVSLYELSLDDDKNVNIDGATTAPQQVATFITTGTTFTIPNVLITAETSSASHWYFATVDAQLVKLGSATVDPTVAVGTNNSPFGVGTTFSDVQAVTNKFTPGPGKAAPAVRIAGASGGVGARHASFGAAR